MAKVAPIDRMFFGFLRMGKGKMQMDLRRNKLLPLKRPPQIGLHFARVGLRSG